ncbi:Lrp/AsnC family transcriptional regulator [Leucobacter japonicus]|uniref:Lrp/AsnC family transcriptional regulator n=1 Tax=Leucobacter japonicus TaxID=1461259 RepID=UPI0006A75E47|nr:Lrp/AsnC family transcriptional regulator [Leucobacter japonicus]
MEHGTETAELRRRVLRGLRENGRASYSRIAAELGVTRRQVTQIVQHAISRGELRLSVSISPDLLGLERFAYLQLSVTGPIAPVRSALAAMPESTFVADISGRYSIDVEVRVGTDPHLRDTVDRVRELPGVHEVRTHLYESIEVNRYSPLRTGRTAFVIDDADRAIVQHLQRDGRASFRELGAAAGISPSGARLRFERLARNGAVKVVGIPVRGALASADGSSDRVETPSLGVGVQIRGKLADALASVRALDPEFVAVTVGDYDLIATLSADSYEELLDLADQLRTLPEVARIETWANLRIVKEQYGESDRLSASPRTLRAADRAGTAHRRPAMDAQDPPPRGRESQR